MLRPLVRVGGLSVVSATVIGAQGVAVGPGTVGPSGRVQAGQVLAALEVGEAQTVSVASNRVVCEAASPAGCPAVPALAGLADTAPGATARLARRTVVVTNAGPGVLALRADEGATDAAWRLADARVLAAGEAAVLVYDVARSRWRIQGAAPRALPAPTGSR